jgi:hypothetical protein
MKVPIYLESTLELLAVVEVEGYYLDALRNQRFIEFAYTGPMSTAPYPGPGPMPPSATFTAHYARFMLVTYRNAFAETFAMTTTKREHVAAWPRRVWPRQKKKNRYKSTKAERKDKRQFLATNPHAMTLDQVRDPLYRKLVHKTPRP